jgi:transposase
MSAPLIDDELWALVERLLPPPKLRRKRHPGRLPISDRAVLNGILFVLKTGIRWNPTADRVGLRLRRDLLASVAQLAAGGSVEQAAWTAAGQAARIWPTRFLICGCRFIVRASRWGGPKTGPNPTDRARPGSKHHILVDANGVPVSVILTGANLNDVTQLLPLVDAIPPIRGIRGRPLLKPKVIYADRGYDSDLHRRQLRERGIRPMIARRRIGHGSGLGRSRWVVERTHS